MKTLKDLEDSADRSEMVEPTEIRDTIIDDINELREESKRFEHGDPLDENRKCTNDDGCAEAGFCIDPNLDIILYLKNKFNITDKELKQ